MTEFEALDFFAKGQMSELVAELERAETVLRQRFPSIASSDLRNKLLAVCERLNADSSQPLNAENLVLTFERLYSVAR